MRLFIYLPRFVRAIKRQLQTDYEQQGESWLSQPKLDQETRIYQRYLHYFHNWQTMGQPIPWTKIAVYALIAWVRENYL